MQNIHPLLSHDTLRKWSCSKRCFLQKSDLIYPLFILDDDNAKEPISNMPMQFRLGINNVISYLHPLVEKGLKTILLFGVINNNKKDAIGSLADDEKNPVIRCIPLIRQHFPDLLIAVDVCLCPYTSHGHCGILNSQGKIENESSIERISNIALAYAEAKAHILAPSDMNDNRVAAIKAKLHQHRARLDSILVMSYSAKFASKFYSPFREAVNTGDIGVDRKCYQLPCSSPSLAIKAVSRDIEQGADIVIVKPGLPYLDVIKTTRDLFPNIVLAAYQVSGEYAMLHAAASSGMLDLKDTLLECMFAFKRAGCDVVISYFTPILLDIIPHCADH